MTRFTGMLAGGHPNSLGRTPEAVALVLADRSLLDELVASIADPDEVVRMRVGDALEKVCRERPEWFRDRVDVVLDRLGAIEQPSVQWHVAQILHHVRRDLTDDERARATELLQRRLRTASDWIVLNVTMDVLTQWASHDDRLADWLVPELERLQQDRRRSVSTRAGKRLSELSSRPPAAPSSRRSTR